MLLCTMETVSHLSSIIDGRDREVVLFNFKAFN